MGGAGRVAPGSPSLVIQTSFLGDVVLTTVVGTIPGDAVKAVFPSSGTDAFDVTYTLTADNDIQGITVTGPFYEGSDDVTYDLEFDLAADEVSIVAPV